MERTCRLFLLLLLFPLLQACGTTVKDTIYPVTRSTVFAKPKKVVILPFADHSPADSPQGYWQRNVRITEALQDELLRYGYTPAIQDDVIRSLADAGIIEESREAPQPSGASALLLHELAKDEWSGQMKAEFRKALHNNSVTRRPDDPDTGYWNKRRLLPLDHKAIERLGREFGADYIVRGRIMVFKAGQEDSFDPAQTGLLPFFFKVGNRAVFGVAQSETYEMIDKMALGGIAGAAMAANNWPATATSSTSVVGHPRFGGGLVTSTESASGLNAAIWGAAGMGLAHLAEKGGKVDSAVVQLRMVVQDAKTGEIVWTNRAEVKVLPESFFGERDEDTLIARAIQGVAASLVDNFVASENSGKVVRVAADGALTTDPAPGRKTPEAATVQQLIDAHQAGKGEQAAWASLEALEELSRRQGTGEITLFFPLGSANMAESERSRLIRFADTLARTSQGRRLLLVAVGSASALGGEDYNLQLAERRAAAPRELLRKYLVNIPHQFHAIYGTGERYSPQNVSMAEHQRYQHVRIIAVFDPEQLPANLNPPQDKGV